MEKLPCLDRQIIQRAAKRNMINDGGLESLDV
jgi:hypothetical protein